MIYTAQQACNHFNQQIEQINASMAKINSINNKYPGIGFDGIGLKDPFILSFDKNLPYDIIKFTGHNQLVADVSFIDTELNSAIYYGHMYVTPVATFMTFNKVMIINYDVNNIIPKHLKDFVDINLLKHINNLSLEVHTSSHDYERYIKLMALL